MKLTDISRSCGNMLPAGSTTQEAATPSTAQAVKPATIQPDALEINLSNLQGQLLGPVGAGQPIDPAAVAATKSKLAKRVQNAVDMTNLGRWAGTPLADAPDVNGLTKVGLVDTYAFIAADNTQLNYPKQTAFVNESDGTFFLKVSGQQNDDVLGSIQATYWFGPVPIERRVVDQFEVDGNQVRILDATLPGADKPQLAMRIGEGDHAIQLHGDEASGYTQNALPHHPPMGLHELAKALINAFPDDFNPAAP